MRRILNKLGIYDNARMINNAFRTDVHSRMVFADAREQHDTLCASIDAINSRCGGDTLYCSEQPIFVFSACWSSGSTLLQRMLTHNGEAIIWGEPFAFCAIAPNLCDQLRPVSANWPDRNNSFKALENEPSDSWIANLHPELETLISSQRMFLQHLYRDPAVALGRTRWGFKEVRYGSDEARYLRLLFPLAKFLFLVRNPIDAYGSFKRRIYQDFERWPERPICTPKQFTDMWARLAEDLAENADELDALLVRYEDLVSSETISNNLSSHVGYEVPPAASMRVIGRSANVRSDYIPRIDRLIVASRARKVGAKLGYKL